MALSNDLISQFVKATRDNKKTSNETTVYGTIVYDGKPYVKIDGSDLLTPVSTTAGVVDGERVTVLIKNHSAIVTGNVSSPSVRHDEVKDVIDEIAEFEILMAYKISTDELTAISAVIEELRAAAAKITDLEAVTALIDSLEAKYANLENVTAEDLEAINADIENLTAIFAEFTDVSTEDLEAVNAQIDNLNAYNADFTYVSAENLSALKAEIKKLDVEKLDAEEAELKYVNIDFGNIDKAWMEEFYARSGLIEYITAEDATVTGQIVGVTIKGDLIEGGTIVADKLVVLGEDGLYYKLNFESGNFASAEEVPTDGLHGSVIVAQSVTADKISVSDLVAFGATIGGFHITDNSIYSGVKESVDNGTRGAYLDSDGQFSLGDSNNFLRYYKEVDEEGNDVLDADGNQIYKLEISAESILFGANSKSSAADLKALTEHVKIGTYNEPIIDENGDSVLDEEGNPAYDPKPSVELAEGDSDFKQVITNTKTMFMDGADVRTEINTDGIETENVTIRGELRQNGFVWATRVNGNYGLIWRGGTR